MQSWFPNFEKYSNENIYRQNIIFVKEDGTTDMELNPEETKNRIADDDLSFLWGCTVVPVEE